jgi:hypothetical protein
MAVPNLLFIDTNIWLDFYRHPIKEGLRLLKHTEGIKDKLIVTYQLETEFKANRQAAIIEGLKAFKEPGGFAHPGILSEAKATAVLARNMKEGNRRVRELKARMLRALEEPTVHDPVYKVCQRVFHKRDDLNLNRTDKIRHTIRRRAFKRFLHGCPPRKRNDTSVGDAFNWEWMIHCAKERTSGLVIVTRDTDYGVSYDNHSYINDHLRQEFSERVSQKRDLLLCATLSDALKLFSIEISKQEEVAEKEVVNNIVAQRMKWVAQGFKMPPQALSLYRSIIQAPISKSDMDEALKAAFYGEIVPNDEGGS